MAEKRGEEENIYECLYDMVDIFIPATPSNSPDDQEDTDDIQSRSPSVDRIRRPEINPELPALPPVVVEPERHLWPMNEEIEEFNIYDRRGSLHEIAAEVFPRSPSNSPDDQQDVDDIQSGFPLVDRMLRNLDLRRPVFNPERPALPPVEVEPPRPLRIQRNLSPQPGDCGCGPGVQCVLGIGLTSFAVGVGSFVWLYFDSDSVPAAVLCGAGFIIFISALVVAEVLSHREHRILRIVDPLPQRALRF